MYLNIPAELRALPQWVVWKAVDIGAKKLTKVPYDPKSGNGASVNDPNTWSDFDTAIQKCKNGFSGIGFVFTNNDPYTFIDLDDPAGDQVILDRQVKIFKQFDSYSEISPSGTGLHTIIKGSIPQGRRRENVEIYSSQRYATMTGNVYLNKPIAARQEILTTLWEQMGAEAPITNTTVDAEEKHTDDEIIKMASEAVNGEKFITLLNNKWNDLYPSQSEADFSFIDIIAFYTQNREQIKRIFRRSLMGARIKAKRDKYVSDMINRSFDRILPPVDLDGFRIAVEKALEINKEIISPKLNKFDTDNSASTPISPKHLTLPPGLMGEIAQFVYAAAPRPVPEIALAAAIGLMAGICGRAYNVSNTGLNQYILLLAKTGMGKEGMAAGIDKLMNAIRFQVPTANEFIGPSHISSGQALLKYIHKKSQCFVSILGEFGLRVQSMSSEHASNYERMLKQILLEVYQKSGHTDIFRASIHADLEKNTLDTASPAFSILGESTPHTFYQALTEDMIVEGLLPRFMLIEYNGMRPALNENHATAYPSNSLQEKFASLVANCSMIMHAKRVITINFAEDAYKVSKNFDQYATLQINGTSNEVVLNLWNRAHLKAIKLAGLIAVGVNPYDPLISLDHLNWGINMVVHDIRSLSAKFEAGTFGSSSSEIKQIEELKRVCKEYITMSWDEIKKYKGEESLYRARIIPYTYINRRLIALSAFRLDRVGATNALKRTIQILIDSDIVREIGKTELAQKYGTTQRAFIIRDMRILD